MENYTLNTESKDIVGGINEVDSFNDITIPDGEIDLWAATEDGEITTTVSQDIFNSIKNAIDSHQQVIIRTQQDGTEAIYKSIAAAFNETHTHYSFCFVDYNVPGQSFRLKFCSIYNNLSCRVFTKNIPNSALVVQLPENLHNNIVNVGESKILQIDNIEPSLAEAVLNKRPIILYNPSGDMYSICSSGHPTDRWSLLVIDYASDLVTYENTRIILYLLVLDKENPSQLTVAHFKEI